MEKGYEENRADWHILTKTRGGTVSLIRNLTLSDALKIKRRLVPQSYVSTTDEGVMDSTFRYLSNSDIELCEILGPDGWKEYTTSSPNVVW